MHNEPNTLTVNDLIAELRKPGKVFLHPNARSELKFEVIKRDMIRELLDNFYPAKKFYWVRINDGSLYVFYLGEEKQ